MEFKKFSWKFLCGFFLLGQGSYHSSNLSPKKSLALFIPSTLYLLYLIVMMFQLFYLNINQLLDIKFSLRSMYVLILFFNCITALKCSPLFPNSIKEMLNEFECLEHYSSQTLQMRWSYKRCEWKILQKFFTIMVLYSVRIGVKLILRGANPFFLVFFTYSMVAITFVASMHALFYLETLHFMMETINECLSNPNKKRDGSVNSVCKIAIDYSEDTAYAEIEIFQNIHYKIWQISSLISENFGWIFVFFFMQAMVNIWKLVTWLAIDLHEDDFITENRVLSMYYCIYEVEAIRV